MEAQAHRLDQVSGARLVGGEMLEWSDLRSRPSSGVSEQLLDHLLPASGSFGSVLLVGARAASLAERVPPSASIDVLVRGLPDARTLAVAAKLRPAVTIHCGTAAAFSPPRGFDVVVLLDGPEQVVSPDGDALSHAGLLALVSSWLAPEGTLVARVENELGLEHLFALDVTSRRDDDSAWGWEAPGTAVRPLYLRELGPALADAGLVAHATYAALPSADDASLVVTPEGLADLAVTGRATALGARAFADLYRDRPSLTEPYDLARQLFESGELLALAPAWLIVASRADSPTPTEPLPALLAVESRLRTEWAVQHTVVREGDKIAWTMRPIQGGLEHRERSVVRRVEDSPLDTAPGSSLEALLREACSHHDVATVRRLVQTYDAWLRAGAASGDDPRFFAVPGNVLVTDSGLTLLDPTWGLSTRVADDVLVVHGLRDFATRLLAAGSEHPWAGDISPDALTRTLAAMASLMVKPALIDELARLEAEVHVVLEGGDAVAESIAYARILSAGRSQFLAQSGASRGYRQAVAASIRLAQDLDARSAKVEWLEATLATRDRRVDSLERQLASTWSSASFKIGRFITWPVRVIVQGLKRVVYAVLPMDLVKKAEAAVKRFLNR